MKRILCMLMALVMLLSLGTQAFADEVLYCRICGKKIPADSKVCQYCGKEVVHPDQSAAPASPAPSAPAVPAASPTPSVSPTLAAEGTAVKTAASPVTALAPGPFSTTLGTASVPPRVRVTKSPTSESVPYGGSCCFIAHAVNATTITWYIASADSSVISTVSDAARKVSGLYVSGANADTLYLSGIPSWMNGCQVQARFDGEGGPVYTDIARIWTYQPAKSWSFWDWFNSYYWDDLYPWWDRPAWDSGNPPPPDVSRAITASDGKSIAPPIKPGEYVQPAIIVDHEHTPADPDLGVVVGHTHESNTGSDNDGDGGSSSTGGDSNNNAAPGTPPPGMNLPTPPSS